MASRESEQLGLRERKKLEAMTRMRVAARDLMWDRGYEAVTTKEIAARADVGEATLFRYFSSKLEMFLMVYGEEFQDVIDACAKQEAEHEVSEVPDAEIFLDRIVRNYQMFGDLYVRYPDLAFTFVKESFGSHTDVGQSGLTYANQWFDLLESIVRQAQKAGVFASIDPAAVVQNCHALYVHEVLRSHARGLPSGEMPDRLTRRLEVLLRPLQVLPKKQWLGQLSSI